MKKKKLLSSLLAIVLSISTLFAINSAYAWIKREWSPYLYSPELTVQTNGSLSIKLAESGTSMNSINLNSILGLNDNFKLQQVSSLTGEADTFFGIDYSSTRGNEKLKYLDRGTTSASTFAHSKGYIEQVFILVCQATEQGATAFTKYIFIDSSSSYIALYNSATNTTLDASEALRCSITIESGSISGISGSSNIHYLFKRTVDPTHKHVGATYTVPAGQTLPTEDGKNIYVTDEYGTLSYNETVCATNNNVHTFSDFNGGGLDPDTNSYSLLTAQNSLFTMSNVESRKVTIRLWLEGYDENCKDEIAGSKILFKIVFKSIDISSSSN